MSELCPGREGRNLTVQTFKCPKCNAEVEIFSDEMRVRCRKCGTMVERKQVAPDCLDWCVVAEKELDAEKPQIDKPVKNS